MGGFFLIEWAGQGRGIMGRVISAIFPGRGSTLGPKPASLPVAPSVCVCERVCVLLCKGPVRQR